MQAIEPLLPGVIYHIYNHGAGTRNPFPDPGHIRRFLDLMDKYIDPVAEMYAWCIMPNHFHLLAGIRENRVYQYKSDDFVQNPEEYREHRWKTVEYTGRPQHDDRKGTANREDRAMPIPHLHFSHLFNAYSRYYNTRNESRGVLFERPFRRKRIENEEHLRTAVVYIHNNPVHHGFCKHPGEYPWSSYRSCLSDKPTRVGREKVIGWFGKTEDFISMHATTHKLTPNLTGPASNLTGPADLSGYPSSDGNSISDSNNSNNLTGSADLSGYPSSDGNSISGSNNSNNLTGSADLSGYPSSDGNSTSDNNNNNNLTGPADLSGYPSSDGNSISDSNNNNNLTGPADLSGYPSSDGNSISGSNNSNNLTGSADLSGYPSSDGNSTSDSNNSNNLTGSADLSGYPSSDGNSTSGSNNSNNLTGPADLSGYPSSDGNSISDSNNSNNLTGPADLSGYPSSDGNSISDNNNNKSIKLSTE